MTSHLAAINHKATQLLGYFAIHERRSIQYLTLVTIGVCILPMLLEMLGLDFSTQAATVVPPSMLGEQNTVQLTNEIHGVLRGSFVHTILEWSAFCTGVLTAILAFVHFALDRDVATPIVGLSMFYAGCMDAFHTLAADRLITGVAASETLIPFTWAICRLFSALILVVGVGFFLISPKRGFQSRGGKMSFLLTASIVLALFAYITIAICVQMEQLPQTMFPHAVITRPWDIIPLVLFVVTGLFVLPQFYHRYPTIFAQSLIVSTIPQVATQLHMSFGSHALFDSDFNIAHFLKILAYLIPFIGLCLTYISIHYDKEAALQQLTQTEERLKSSNLRLEENIQKLKSTQSQLVQNEKMSGLGQLVAGVAHEINNPVNFIHGNLVHTQQYIANLQDILDLYQQYYPEPEPAIADHIDEIELDYLLNDLDKMLTSMKIGSERIRNIVLSLRNFSRLDEADAKPTDIHQGLDSTLLILGNRLKFAQGTSEISIVKQYGELPLITCYPGQLNQVFMNILSNAIDSFADLQTDHKHLDLKPTICISTEFKKNQCFIQIADNGSGISKSMQTKIFDPFFTTKPIGKGTGLGLSISYQIVTETHGGRLYCTSSVGMGTEFTVVIPQPLST